MLYQPLANRLRPQTLEEFVGQTHLLGPQKILSEMLLNKKLFSLIFWGPPGCGKTTLASLIANNFNAKFYPLSAVSSGVRELKKIFEEALPLKKQNIPSILFIDEIHRFTKTQQDALLPYVENGTVFLIGATTENPSFEVISALLSRCRVLVLHKLLKNDLKLIIKRALTDSDKGLGSVKLTLEETTLDFLIESCDGDSRHILNTLEIASALTKNKVIGLEVLQQALQQKALYYDKNGEEHYNIISAFIKSLRGSNPHAALYWLARMIEAGESPLFIARRLVIFASEDIGNADPQGLSVAISCMHAVDFIGLPECRLNLAQATTYLACAAKSNASYKAYEKASHDVKKWGTLPVPLHLRNAVTKLMKDQDYGKNYQYPHNYENAKTDQQYMPDKLNNQKYYEPKEMGYEKKIREQMKFWESQLKLSS